MTENVGAIIIGRNEGERLKNCIRSVQMSVSTLVYVDSGSTDESVDFAREQGIYIVELDMKIPFSAARARNEGFKCLTQNTSKLEFVQFIDGDCELDTQWIPKAVDFLEKQSQYAIVTGRRIEKNPDASIYNQMCDYEWNTPIGDASACGGDFLIRTKAFDAVRGFNPSVVAGEEPEMCYRLSQKGWNIYRLDASMTYHDAAMKSFSQWWNRTKRTGHAYLQGFMLHRNDKKGYYFKESIKDWIWGFFFPLAVIIISTQYNAMALLMFSFYPLRLLRVFLKIKKKAGSSLNAFIYSFFLILSNIPQLTGQFLYLSRKMTGTDIKIIEYSI